MGARYQNFRRGIGLVPNSTDQNLVTGDLNVVTGDGKLYLRNNLQVTASSAVVTEDHSATLKNKTLNFDTGTTGNSISNVPDSALTANVLLANGVQTNTGTKSFNSSTLLFNGATSGSTTLNATAIASGVLTLPAATDTLVARETTDTLKNKTLDGSFNTFLNIPSSALPANVLYTDQIQTVTGAKSFDSAKLLLNGATSGSTTLNASAIASGTLTLPAATDTLVGKATSDTLTNKTLDFNTGITGNSISNIPDTALTSNVLLVNGVQTVTGAKSFDSGKLILNGSGSGFTTLNASATASGTLTLPAATDVLVGRDTNDTLTNKTLTSPVLNTPTADTITGIAGADLTIQSAAGYDVVLLGNATNSVKIEDLTVNATTISGSPITLNATGTLTLTGSTGVKVSNGLFLAETVNSTLTGANAIVPSPVTGTISLTNGSLSSIDEITNNGDVQFLVITNKTGNDITINNETGSTASNRILTGTNAALSLKADASLSLVYSSNASRWMVVGGTGAGGGGAGGATFDGIAGENLTAGEAVYISNGTGTDSGRTAGRAYKLDATNSDRVEFVGFATVTVSAGATVTIKTIGEVTGLSGLTIGKPVFASISSPGALQTSAPNVLNQWIIPVGIATSATSMSINGAGSSTAVQISGALVDNLYSAVDTYSTNTTITNNAGVVLVNAASGSVTITVPAATGNKGKIFNIKKIDSSANAVIIATGSGNIDGTATKTLAFQYDSLMLASDGTNYYLI